MTGWFGLVAFQSLCFAGNATIATLGLLSLGDGGGIDATGLRFGRLGRWSSLRLLEGGLGMGWRTDVDRRRGN